MTCSTRSPGCPSTIRPAPRPRSCASARREIAAASGADTLVELGSGTSEKTRILLDALRDSGSLRRFIPFDVDAGVLEAAGAAIAT